MLYKNSLKVRIKESNRWWPGGAGGAGGARVAMSMVQPRKEIRGLTLVNYVSVTLERTSDH